MFPVVFIGLTWLFFFFSSFTSEKQITIAQVNHSFIITAPFILAGVFIWFLVAWFSHSAMINSATDSKPLARSENKRVYNLVENLCISTGMTMPKVNIIEDDSLNAFASGINSNTFSVSLSRGIIDKLNDQELEAVIAHELTHVKNLDIRLMSIVSVMVGLVALLGDWFFRISFRGNSKSSEKKGELGAIIMVLGIVFAILSPIIAKLIQLAISRRREFMADAGSVEITRQPTGLIAALEKLFRVSNDE